MIDKLAILGMLGLMAPPLAAAQILAVERVVSPAWVERADGGRQPLAAGVALGNKDRIHTGSGARVLLRMTEGSAVKLGENATLALDDLNEKNGGNASRLVSASLDVLRGAFRFTTGIFGRQRAGRDIRIRITTVTAGIRGTDVWGKSSGDRDIVCLIEGRIGVEHGGRQFTMQDPLSFFIAPRAGKPQPVAPVSRRQIDEWVEETEIREGGGAIREGGGYGVDFADAMDQDAATQIYDKAREAGFPAEIETVRSEYGSDQYRVRILNLTGAKDAQAVVEKLKSLGFSQVQVSR